MPTAGMIPRRFSQQPFSRSHLAKGHFHSRSCQLIASTRRDRVVRHFASETPTSPETPEPGVTAAGAPSPPLSLLPPDPKKSPVSPGKVWEQETERLLFLDVDWSIQQTRYNAETALKWWANERPIRPEAVKNTWRLFDRLLRAHKERQLQNSDSARDSNIVDLLNTTLDHWKFAWKDGVELPKEFAPNAVLHKLKSIPEADVRSYTILLTAMAHWKDVDPFVAESVLDHLLKESKENNRSDLLPSTFTWNALLNVWAKCRWPKAFEHAMAVKERMQEHGIEPDVVTYSTILEAASTMPTIGQWSPTEADDLINEMKQRGLQFDPLIYFHWIQAWGKSAGPQGADRAREILNTMPETNKQCYSAVMAAYARRGNVPVVQELFQELQNLYHSSGQPDRFMPTVETFNSVLDAYAKSRLPGSAEQAQRTLERMYEWAVQSGNARCMPDITSVNTVLHAWAESDAADSVDRVEAILHAIEKWPGVQPDSYTYTTIIKTWARSDRNGAADQCEALLKAMWESYYSGHESVKPNNVTYSTVIYAWSRAKTFHAPMRAEAVFNNMMEKYKDGDATLKPVEMTYASLITTWSRSKRKEVASRTQYYYDQMRGKYLAGDDTLRPSTKIYHALLHAKKAVGDGEGAQRLLEQMIEEFKDGHVAAQPNAYTFNLLMAAWVNSGHAEAGRKVESILIRMKECHERYGWNCKPTTVSFTTLLHAWAKSSPQVGPERAEAILNHMKAIAAAGDSSIRPSGYCYGTVISAWAKSRAKDAPLRAQALFDEMMALYEAGDDTMRPTSTACCSLITAWANHYSQEAPHKALAILDDIERRHRENPTNERADNMHYSATISAFARIGDVKTAENLLKRAIETDGVQVHTSCFNAVISANARSYLPDAAERCERWLRRMTQEFKIPPDVVTYTTCINTWQFSKDPNAVERATALLVEMMGKAGPNMRGSLAPNTRTFISYLKVVAKSKINNKQATAEQAMQLMKKMGLPLTADVQAVLKQCRDLQANGQTAS